VSDARRASSSIIVPPSVFMHFNSYRGCVSFFPPLVGMPYRTSYAASKFAVQGYCESLRSELASSGVSVHVVSPGYIRTDLSLSAVMGDGRSNSKMDETTANGTCTFYPRRSFSMCVFVSAFGIGSCCRD
jgi:NAD(P)-dependent dehydrogenase (short-subunit alcohol dehydrogenase family)